MEVTSFLIVLLAPFGLCDLGPNWPPYLTICKRNDPNLAKCLINDAEKIREHLKNGVPEFGFPPLDPFRISGIKVSFGTFTVSLSDVEIHNGYNYVPKSVDVDFDNAIVSMTFNMPYLYASTKYSVVGEVLMLKLNSSGTAYGNVTDVDVLLNATGSYKEVDGKKYVVFGAIDIKLHVNGAFKVKIENLFPGRQEIEDQFNNMINENGLELLRQYRRYLLDAINYYAGQVLNKLFSTYSFDDLFPLE